MRIGKTLSGHYGGHDIFEMKYNGQIVWPKWSLALSTDQLRFSAAGGSSTLYVVAAAVNENGTPIRRIPLEESDLRITKYGDAGGRVKRQGLVFSSENLGTTPYDAVSGYYLIEWLEKGLSIQLPFSQALNRIEQTIAPHTVTTGLGALEFSPAIAPVLGGEVSVTCVRTYTLVDAEYIWSSGTHQGGMEHPYQTETVRPQSLTCTPNPVYIGADYVTIGSNAHCTDIQYYRVKAEYDDVYSSEWTLEQAADSYTAVEVPVADSYFAYITVFGSGGLTAKGGSCTLQANAGHYAKTEYRWASGGSTFSDSYLVTDGYEISKTGDSERFHISGLNVTHDNMQKRTRDAIVFIATNLGDNVTRAQTSEIAIANNKTLVTPASDVTTAYGNLTFIPATVPITGGLLEVSGTRTHVVTDALYEWDSGVQEGGTSRTLSEVEHPQSVSCSAGTAASRYTLNITTNAHNTSIRQITVNATYDGITATSHINQSADSYTATTEYTGYHAKISVLQNTFSAIGGSCQLSVESWHDERTKYNWASGDATYSDWQRKNDGYEITKSGDSSYFTVSGLTATHDNMQARGTDRIQFTVTNTSDHTTSGSTNVITITNTATPKQTTAFTLTTPYWGDVPASGDSSILFNYASYREDWTEYASGYVSQHVRTHRIADLHTTVGTLSSSTTTAATGSVYLNVPANTAITERDIVVTMTWYDSTRTVTLHQEAAPIVYTYVVTRAYAVYSNGGNILLARGSDAVGGNYATLKGDVEVYRNGELYNTLRDINLAMHRESGDATIKIQNNRIVASNLGTTRKDEASAYFTGTYETSAKSSQVKVSQQGNAPTSTRTYNIALTSSTTTIGYTGGDIRISYTSVYTEVTVWTSGATQTVEDQPATSSLAASRGTLSADSVSGSGYVTLTVPRNSGYTPISFNVTITSPTGTTDTLSLTQEAQEHPLEYYIEVTESTRSGYRDITIKNNYTSTLSGYVRCDVYDDYGTFVTYTEISFNLASGATKAATRIPYGYGYSVNYTKHVN